MANQNRKVVALNTDHMKSGNSGQQERQTIISACRAVVEQQFQRSVSDFFDQTDDELFALSDKAESSTLQTLYFDAMRSVRKDRDRVQQRYLDDLLKRYDHFWSGTIHRSTQENRTKTNDDSDLSLIDNEALEEQLAVSTMIDKGNNRFDRSLHALNARFANMSGRRSVANADNPVAPASVCHTFDPIIKQLDLDLKIKLVIYKLFDRIVLSRVGSIYDALNGILIEHRILPKLTGPIPRRGDTVHHVPPNAPHGTGGDDHPNAAPYLEAFHMMQSLLGGYRAHYGIAPSAEATTGPRYDSEEILSALSLLQTSALSGPDDVVTLGLKRYVANELKKLQPDDNERPIAKIDEDTIDMVSMVFDFILDDDNLPSPVKALLGRLQIPVVKAAILEKSFFSKESHPARQLLNKLAQVGVTLSDETCAGNPAFAQIESIVQRVLADFENDVGLFAELLEEFTHFMEADAQRSQRLEERTIQVTASQEQRALAKKTVAREIAQRIHGKELPPFICDFLEGPWSDVLFLTFLRKEKDSGAWAGALNTVNDLLSTITPPPDPEGKQHILKAVPQLVTQIRTGLETISYDQHKMDELFKQLENCHLAVLTGQALERPASSAPATDPLAPVRIDSATVKNPVLAAEIEDVAKRLADADQIIASGDNRHNASGQEIVLQSEESRDLLMADVGDEFLARVKLLEVGQWLQLTDENNRIVRAKLSWKSPITSLCVFVNRKGIKVAEKTLHGLAAELRRGSAVVLEGGQVPLMDRAFSAMMTALKNPEKQARKEARAYLSQSLETSPASHK